MTEPRKPRKAPAKSGQRADHATRFQPGNPGKPKGARSRVTRALEALLGNSAEDVALAVIKAAQDGDTAAARLVLERVMPARRDNPVEFTMPPIDGPDSLLRAGEAVLAAVAGGDLTPDEGDALMGLLERQRRLVETADLAERVTRLEGNSGDAG